MNSTRSLVPGMTNPVSRFPFDLRLVLITLMSRVALQPSLQRLQHVLTRPTKSWDFAAVISPKQLDHASGWLCRLPWQPTYTSREGSGCPNVVSSVETSNCAPGHQTTLPKPPHPKAVRHEYQS